MIPQKPNIIKSPLCYAGDTRTIPQTTPAGTNQLSYESGFPLLTSTPIQAGGIPPDRLDFNAALNLLSTFIYYMQSGNQFVWSNQLDYNAGALVLGSDNAVYFCIKANGATSPNTVQNPLSAPSYWLRIINTGGKINADNLSVALGAFALLNSISLTDSKITGQLPSTKLQDSAVTNAKIANAAVNDAKISGVSASKVTGLATVATSGSYNDLTNKPTIPTNVAPLPTRNTTAAGWWISQYFLSAIDAALPSGGTWAYFAIGLNSNGSIAVDSLITNVRGTVAAGGTNLNFTSPVQYVAVLCWRIQ